MKNTVQLDFNNIDTIPQFVDKSFQKNLNKTLFKTKRSFRTETYSYAEIYSYLKAADSFFDSIDIKQGEKILIIGLNSPEFATLILAGFYSNRTIVPADIRSSKELLQSYVELTKPKFVFTTRLRSKDISKVTKNYLIIEDLFEYLKPHLGKNNNLIKANPDDLAEIIFTSGTTGAPKGVMLTHKNIVSNIKSCNELIPSFPEFEALSVLPLSHMYEQILGLLVPISAGAKVCYVKKVSALAIKRALNEWEITHLTIVPQILKNLYRTIEREADKKGKKDAFHKLLKISGKLPFFARKVLFNQVHKSMGGHIKFITTGGAKLDVTTAQNWVNMGIKVLEGYGATEVTAIATGNRINDWELGSVGWPLLDVEIKIDTNDEVLIKGPSVSPGYYENKEKTEAAFTKDGWYRTGDMGKIKGKRLYLMGRDAFKIVLSSGENVYVEDLESVLNKQKEIWESCVINLEQEGRERVHAVVIVNEGFSQESVITAIENANKELETHQQIASHSIWNEDDFPRTHTLKINRKLIKEKVEANETMASEAMEPSQEKDDLISLIAEVSGGDTSKITLETNLGSDLNMDSIDRVELIALLEDEFNVFIDDYAITAQTTVGNLKEMIETSAQPTVGNEIDFKYFRAPYTYLRWAFWKFMFLPIHGLFLKREIVGLENLRNVEGPVIFAFNHIGPFDQFLFIKYLKNSQLLTLANAAENKLWNKKSSSFKFLMNALVGGVPMSPDQTSGVRASLERVGAILDKGLSITLAPEGKITRTGKMQRFKRGIGVIASEMKVPIVPVKIHPENYTKIFRVSTTPGAETPASYFLPRLGQGKANVKIVIGKPLNLAGYSYNIATEIIEDTIRSL